MAADPALDDACGIGSAQRERDGREGEIGRAPS